MGPGTSCVYIFYYNMPILFCVNILSFDPRSGRQVQIIKKKKERKKELR